MSPPTEKANPGHLGTAALWKNELSALAATLMLSPNAATTAISHGCIESRLLSDVDADVLSNVGQVASHATIVFGVGGGGVGVGRGGGLTARNPLRFGQEQFATVGCAVDGSCTTIRTTNLL